MELVEIEVARVDVSAANVRKRQVEEDIESLAQSIEREGLLQPILVTAKGDRYDLIVGQRRLLAFKRLGREIIPALVLSAIDMPRAMLLSLMENVQRRDIDPRDRAAAMVAAVAHYGGYAAAANALGYSEATVRRWTEFDGAWEELKQLVSDRRMTRGEAVRLMRFEHEKAVAIGRGLAGLEREVRDRMVDIAQARPMLTVEQVAAEAANPPDRPITVRFYTLVYEALNQAAEDRDQSLDVLMQDIVTAWLQRYAYI